MKLASLKSLISIKSIGFSILLTLLGCKSQQILFPPPVLAFTDLIDFCDLPNHKNESVYTRSIYSEVEGHWALRSENKNCGKFTVELKIPDSSYINPNDKHLVKKIYQKKANTYFIIDAIGIFKTDDTKGSPATDSNSGEFIAEKVIAIQKIIRRKNYQATDSRLIKKGARRVSNSSSSMPGKPVSLQSPYSGGSFIFYNLIDTILRDTKAQQACAH